MVSLAFLWRLDSTLTGVNDAVAGHTCSDGCFARDARRPNVHRKARYLSQARRRKHGMPLYAHHWLKIMRDAVARVRGDLSAQLQIHGHHKVMPTDDASSNRPAPDAPRNTMRANAPVVIELCDPSSSQAHACIHAYFRELQDRLAQGFDPTLSVSADPSELVPPYGWFFIARQNDAVIGCGGLKKTSPAMGEIKRMWVAPAARGAGVAQRLLNTIEHQALSVGLITLRLDTHGDLVEACALYRRNGYTEIPAYNANPYAEFWFEKHL